MYLIELGMAGPNASIKQLVGNQNIEKNELIVIIPCFVGFWMRSTKKS